MSKLIRDAVHGYIEIDDIIVNQIIDTPVFQRLRHIEQTSMRSLYPSAHHDRFVHSLGVYHLGKLAFNGLVNNIKNSAIYDEAKHFWKSYGICFQLACLLHDCGHAPMSHSFEYAYLNPLDPDDCKLKKERFMQSMLVGLIKKEDEYREIILQTQSDVEKYFQDPTKIAPHELVSAQLVSEYFWGRGNLRVVLESLLDERLSAEELNQYIIFMQRAIIGLPYSTSTAANQLEDCFKNCLISLLNGNFFDVDKLDYIIRDTNASGTNNVTIDIPRILNALTLVEINRFNTSTTVTDLELNNSIYFTGCDSKLFDRADASDCECTLDLSDVRLIGKFQGTLLFKGRNNRLKTDTEDGYLEGRRIYEHLTDIDATIEDSCNMAGRFNGQIQIMGHKTPDKSKIDGLVNAKISGKLRGTIIGHIDTTENCELTYEIGYSKTALNVIEDTLIARNRLYLWIYGHHKVTYSDYILRHGILHSFLDESHAELGELEKLRAANELLSKAMDVDSIFLEEKRSQRYLLSDGDLIHQMKASIFNSLENSYAKEWCSRSHMYPIWKSYIEYNNFFSNLSLEQKKKLWKLLFNGDEFSQQDLPSEASTLSFENSILKKFSDEQIYTWIKPAGIKLKEMNASNIYIVLSDNSVKRLKDVISQTKVTEQYADESFFYLYCSQKLEPEEKLKLISFLKTQVKQHD